MVWLNNLKLSICEYYPCKKKVKKKKNFGVWVNLHSPRWSRTTKGSETASQILTAVPQLPGMTRTPSLNFRLRTQLELSVRRKSAKEAAISSLPPPSSCRRVAVRWSPASSGRLPSLGFKILSSNSSSVQTPSPSRQRGGKSPLRTTTSSLIGNGKAVGKTAMVVAGSTVASVRRTWTGELSSDTILFKVKMGNLRVLANTRWSGLMMAGAGAWIWREGGLPRWRLAVIALSSARFTSSLT